MIPAPRCTVCAARLPDKAHINRLFCDDCRAARKRFQSRKRRTADPEQCARWHADWYVQNRKDNPEWREENKRRAKAWRAKNAERRP